MSELKPCAAEALVGTVMHVRYGRRRREVKGIVQNWRYGYGTIEQMRAPTDGTQALCYPSFEVLLKPEDGGLAVWIGPFKDANNPRPSEIWS